MQQPDPAPPSSLPIQAAGQAKQSTATYGSQDSVYFSCWSLPSLTNETEDPKSVKVVNPDLSSELNLGLGWSKGYEGDPSSGRRIWSPPLSKPDDVSRTLRYQLTANGEVKFSLENLEVLFYKPRYLMI